MFLPLTLMPRAFFSRCLSRRSALSKFGMLVLLCQPLSFFHGVVPVWLAHDIVIYAITSLSVTLLVGQFPNVSQGATIALGEHGMLDAHIWIVHSYHPNSTGR